MPSGVHRCALRAGGTHIVPMSGSNVDVAITLSSMHMDEKGKVFPDIQDAQKFGYLDKHSLSSKTIKQMFHLSSKCSSHGILRNMQYAQE